MSSPYCDADRFRCAANLPKSRTAKVRQAAARYQKVKIVSPNWLYDSISNWRKEPEDNYLIEIHPEDRHESSLNGFQEIDDAQMLSSEDEESDEMDEEITSSPADELNAPDMANVGWMDVDEEFKAWIGSDDEEEEEEEEGGGGENQSMASVSTVKSTSSQKRPVKRSRSSTPDASQETNNDDIMDESADKSRSNKRQRTLSDRSLKAGEAGKAEGVGEVGEVISTEGSPETPTDTQEGIDMETREEIDDDDDFDDDSFAAEFERELLAEVENDEEEEEEEAEKDVTTKEATPLKEETEGIVDAGDDGGGGKDKHEMVSS